MSGVRAAKTDPSDGMIFRCRISVIDAADIGSISGASPIGIGQIPLKVEIWQKDQQRHPGMPYTLAPLTRLFLLDDEGIVFSQNQQKLFALNTAACFVWICLETESEPDLIAHKYCDAFSAETSDARNEIELVIAEFRELGLILCESQVTDRVRHLRAQPTEGKPAVPCSARHADQVSWTEQTYVLIGSSIQVQYTSRAQFLYAHPVLEHLQADEPATAPQSRISILEIDNSFHLVRDLRCEAVADSLGFLVARLKSLLVQTAINSARYLMYVHAGVVEKDGFCLMLPATAGSGKSTLTAALLPHGYTYLSDEIALLCESSFRVAPVPISIGLKAGSWRTLESLYPELTDLRIHNREDGKQVRYLPPPESALVKGNSAYPVKTIVFPNYDPSSKTNLKPITKVETLRRLFGDCKAIPLDLTLQQVEDMANWIKSVDCYQLTINDLDEAVAQVDRAQRYSRRTFR